MKYRVKMEIIDIDKEKWDDPPQMVDYIKERLETSRIHITHITTDVLA